MPKIRKSVKTLSVLATFVYYSYFTILLTLSAQYAVQGLRNA